MFIYVYLFLNIVAYTPFFCILPNFSQMGMDSTFTFQTDEISNLPYRPGEVLTEKDFPMSRYTYKIREGEQNWTSDIRGLKDKHM